MIESYVHIDKVQEVQRKKSGKIKIRVWNKSQTVMTATISFLIILTIYGFWTFDYKDIQFWEAIKSTMENLKVMFLEAKWSHFSFSEGMYQLSITLGLAFLSTIIGAFISVCLGLLAAENLSSKRISHVIKLVVAFIRAVPTVLWVLIFAISAGLGSAAAIIGMMLHSIAYLVKAYSEAFEEIDKGVIEALSASGANWFHIVTKAVIPSTITYIVSWTFLRFEINFGVAVAMGAAAGAGGIGFDLFMASGFYFDLREVGFITYAILFVALILEMISTRMKNQYLVSTTSGK